MVGDTDGTKEIVKAVGEVINASVAGKVYDDALSGTLKELGGISHDLVKFLRVLSAPLRLAGNRVERFIRDMEEVKAKVPVERRVEAQPEVAGPLLDGLKYVDEGNPLRSLYLNLLASSIDIERRQNAHPAFVGILNQMSRDEAAILWNLLMHERLQSPKTLGVLFEYRNGRAFVGLVRLVPLGGSKLVRPDVEIPLAYPERLIVYATHLNALLLTEAAEHSGGIKEVTDYGFAALRSTAFGRLFAEACMIEQCMMQSQVSSEPMTPGDGYLYYGSKF